MQCAKLGLHLNVCVLCITRLSSLRKLNTLKCWAWRKTWSANMLGQQKVMCIGVFVYICMRINIDWIFNSNWMQFRIYFIKLNYTWLSLKSSRLIYIKTNWTALPLRICMAKLMQRTSIQTEDSSTITEILKWTVKRSLLNGGVNCEWILIYYTIRMHTQVLSNWPFTATITQLSTDFFYLVKVNF